MFPTPPTVALDIGGANLKAAHSAGSVRFRPFALWKNPAGLSAALDALLRSLPPFGRIAITMTGELCDCFETKEQGVLAILDAVAAAAHRVPILVWRTDGTLVDLATARQAPLLAAAANWLALATYAGRFSPTEAGLVIDIGSTTTDIIPLWQGRPDPVGRTDPERLRSGELVYCGVRRTPVCALLGAEGAAELFATTLDVYLLLDAIAEDAGDCDTADGRPATRDCAHARLARMLCADPESCSLVEARLLAERICERQIAWIARALERVLSRMRERPRSIVLSGSGEFLARWMLAARPPVGVISLMQMLGPDASSAACAHALAILAAERAPTEM